MITRKTFKAIAEIIRKRSLLVTNTPEKAIKDLTNDLASYFKQNNPAFNRDKFIEACRLSDNIERP